MADAVTATASKKARPKRVEQPSLYDEKPIGTPLLAADGSVLRCSDGCGRIADCRNWDTLAPASWNCFIQNLVDGCARRDAEKKAEAEERVKRMNDARAAGRGGDR